MAPRTQHVALVIGALVVLALALTFVWMRPSSSSSSPSSPPGSSFEPGLAPGPNSACVVLGSDGVDHPIMTGKEWRDLFRDLRPGQFTFRVMGPDAIRTMLEGPGAEDYVPGRINLITTNGSEDACVIRAFLG